MNVRGLLSKFGLFSALVFSLGHGLAAQSPEDASVPVIKTSVRRVVLDVVVTGPNGEAIRGLGKNDFKVTEDG